MVITEKKREKRTFIVDNLPELPTEKRTSVNSGGKVVQSQTESGYFDKKEQMKLKSYPQVIHFMWKTVDKSIHRNHSKVNGIHINPESMACGIWKKQKGQ